MNSEYFGLALKNIIKKGVRSWLTMLGIFVGIAAVVSLISLGQGMEDALTDQFAQMGADVIIIMPGDGFASFGSAKLTEHDEKLIERVRGVKNIAPLLTKISQVEYRNEIVYTFVSGIPTDDRYEVIEDMQSVKIASGRRIVEGDKYRAIAGCNFPKGDVFDNKKLKVGDKVAIEGIDFKLVGFLESVGNDQDDSSIWIPLETAQDIFSDKGYDNMMLRVEDGMEPAKVAEEIKKAMRKDRGQDEGEEDFQVQTSEQLLESVGGILSSVQAVVVGIALISLMVGGIGIMNAMYTSVLERTPEIGIMKALGARNSDIRDMFLIESGMLGTFGGIVGIIIGLTISKGFEYIMVNYMNMTLLQASTSPYIIFGALGFSFIVGCLSGVFPAIQASKLKPVDALRYE